MTSGWRKAISMSACAAGLCNLVWLDTADSCSLARFHFSNRLEQLVAKLFSTQGLVTHFPIPHESTSGYARACFPESATAQRTFLHPPLPLEWGSQFPDWLPTKQRRHFALPRSRSFWHPLDRLEYAQHGHELMCGAARPTHRCRVLWGLGVRYPWLPD